MLAFSWLEVGFLFSHDLVIPDSRGQGHHGSPGEMRNQGLYRQQQQQPNKPEVWKPRKILTHYQTPNFRLFQTERVCRRQFQT